MYNNQQIRNDYGSESVKLVRKLEKLSKQKGRHNSHIYFNLQCKHTNLTPKTLQIKLKTESSEAKNILKTRRKSLIKSQNKGKLQTEILH